MRIPSKRTQCAKYAHCAVCDFSESCAQLCAYVRIIDVLPDAYLDMRATSKLGMRESPSLESMPKKQAYIFSFPHWNTVRNRYENYESGQINLVWKNFQNFVNISRYKFSSLVIMPASYLFKFLSYGLWTEIFVSGQGNDGGMLFMELG